MESSTVHLPHRHEQHRHHGAEQDAGGSEHPQAADRPEEKKQLGQRRLPTDQPRLQDVVDRADDENAPKRQSHSAEAMPYRGPAWLPDDLGQHEDWLREAMKNALQGPYPDEYRPPLRHYYEGVYQDLVERQETAP